MSNQKTSQGFSRKVILSFDNLAGFPATGTANNLYYDTATGLMYYWNGTTYVPWGGSETITDITAITNGFRYKNESNTNDDITFEVNSTDPNNVKVEVKLNGTKVAEFPLYTVNNDIQINNSGSEWDLTDDKITILETNGDSKTINFPYRCTVVANPNGTIDIKQNGVTIGTIPAPTADVPYSKMLFVDPINGLDTNTGSDNKMFKTIAKALTVANNSGYRIVLGAGIYAENPTISLQNIDIVTVAGSTRGNTLISGTVTFAHIASSSGIHGISMTNLVHSGAGSLYVKDCQVNTSFSKTSNGYLEVLDSDVTGVSITGTGQAVFVGGKQTVFTVNNAGAIVTVNDSINLAVTTVTAGVLGVTDSIGFASTANGKAITASASTMVLLSNSQFYGSTGLLTSLTLSGNYGINNVQFDKVNSTLGTNLSTIGWFDKVGIINPATITTATKTLVRDANGVVCEQLISLGSTWSTATTDPTATGNTGTLPRFVENTANGSKWYIDGNGIAKVIEGAAIGGQNVYFDAENPASGTIFDIENPPVTNNDAFKEDSQNTYYGTDGSVWTWNGTAYVTKVYNFPTHQLVHTFIATAGQTSFSALPKAPVGAIWGRRNSAGRQLSFTNVGTTVIYTPANNGGMTMDAGDIVEICYEAY